jgi:c-di-GMP-binding flagellar brake protein YcgR
MNSNEDGFKKITDSTEKDKILSDLAQAKGELICKGFAESIFRVTAFKVANKSLFCEPIKNVKNHKIENGETIAHFIIAGQKYFFKTQLHLEQNQLLLSTSFDLFHVQRRNNFRFIIPQSYKAFVSIHEKNGVECKIKANLHDLSAGGCRMLYENLESKVNITDHLKVTLHLGSREPINLNAQIRHMQIDALNKKSLAIGLQFTDLSTQAESKLYSITLELYRELFSKMK